MSTDEEHEGLGRHLVERADDGRDRLVCAAQVLVPVVRHEPGHQVRARVELGLGSERLPHVTTQRFHLFVVSGASGAQPAFAMVATSKVVA